MHIILHHSVTHTYAIENASDNGIGVETYCAEKMKAINMSIKLCRSKFFSSRLIFLGLRAVIKALSLMCIFLRPKPAVKKIQRWPNWRKKSSFIDEKQEKYFSTLDPLFLLEHLFVWNSLLIKHLSLTVLNTRWCSVPHSLFLVFLWTMRSSTLGPRSFWKPQNLDLWLETFFWACATGVLVFSCCFFSFLFSSVNNEN